MEHMEKNLEANTVVEPVVQHDATQEETTPVPVPRKRGRLMKNGALANNNVANLVSFDEQNVEALPIKKMLDDYFQTDDKVV